MRRRVRDAVWMGVCGALLATACATGGADDAATEDEAEVLGIQVERDGDGFATFEPTAEPTPSPDATTDVTATDDDEAPTEAPAVAATGTGSTADGTTTAGDTDTDTDTDSDAPAVPPSPSPSPSPTDAPSPEPEPVALSTREGHSYVAWFRDEESDGQGGTRYVWSEVSAAPVVTRDGSEPLRVGLVDLQGDPDRSAPRRAQCPAWLEVDGDRAVAARGELVVEVVVDGEVVSSGTRDIDVTVQPGERRDLVAIGDVRVAVPDVAEVTCGVRFVEDDSR